MKQWNNYKAQKFSSIRAVREKYLAIDYIYKRKLMAIKTIAIAHKIFAN